MEKADRETRPEDQTEEDDGRSGGREFFFSEELGTNDKMVMDTKATASSRFISIFSFSFDYNGYDRLFNLGCRLKPCFITRFCMFFALSLSALRLILLSMISSIFKHPFWSNENLFMAIVRKIQRLVQVEMERKKKKGGRKCMSRIFSSVDVRSKVFKQLIQNHNRNVLYPTFKLIIKNFLN